MSYEELRDNIGLEPNVSTMQKLFKLRRLDENHPENITLLLPDRNGNQVHYKTTEGWKTGDFYNFMHSAYCADSAFLEAIYPKSRSFDQFHRGFLLGSHAQKLGSSAKDQSKLKPESDQLRPDMFRVCKGLAEKYTSEAVVTNTEADHVGAPQQAALHAASDLKKEDTRQLELKLELKKEDTKQLELNTKQLELKLELRRLDALQQPCA